MIAEERSWGTGRVGGASPADTEVGGYRLVRLLGGGARAGVFLGHADGHPPVAVKLFAPGTPADAIEREAAALLRAAGDHVVRLVDLAQDAHGTPAFVLERLPGRSLGALLERRGKIRPGEAVTILAPLAATVARLHDAGVVHGGLDLGSVLFSANGSPTLVGFGDAVLFDRKATGTGPASRRRELLATDLRALARIAAAVLDATAPDAALPALASLEPGNGFAKRLADAAFAMAAPEPVDLDAEPPAPVPLPGRVTAAGAGHRHSADHDTGPHPRRTRGTGVVLDALQVPDWL